MMNVRTATARPTYYGARDVVPIPVGWSQSDLIRYPEETTLSCTYLVVVVLRVEGTAFTTIVLGSSTGCSKEKMSCTRSRARLSTKGRPARFRYALNRDREKATIMLGPMGQ